MKPDSSSEMLYLMLRFFDNSASQEEFELLNRMMKENESIHQLYFRYLKVYLALKNVRYLNRSGQSDLYLEHFLSEMGRYESSAPAAVTKEHPIVEQKPVCLRKAEVEKPTYRFNKYSFYTAITALAATILIIATIYFMPPRVFPDPVARILDSEQAEWMQQNKSRSRSVLFQGHLQVTKGNLKFVMYDGTEVSLEAPTSVELEHIDRLFLTQGKLRAIVPPLAAGFSVCTPSGSVVDYGTDFSVAVDNAGKTSVEVFKGVVELRDSSNPLIFRVAQKLSAGQTGTIESDGKISWTEPARYYDNGEIRVRWQCPDSAGDWGNPSFWGNGLVRGPELVAEFRAEDSPKMVRVDAGVIGEHKISARRADVGLLSRFPVTVQMDGGQIQLEQLWVGRMGLQNAAEGKWLMSGGELVLKGRDLVMLFVGDKCKGLLEIGGGNVEVFGTVRVGCNEGSGSYMDSDGTLLMNGGKLTIYGILEVAVADSVGVVRLNDGVIRAFDVRIDQKGMFLVNGGTLVLEGDKTERTHNMINAGYMRTEGREITVFYDEDDSRGFGRDKTIIIAN
jgi:hypothetical protein